MTWQLDPTCRFPQACFDWVASQQPQSQTEAYLLAARWIVDNGFTYDNTGAWRLSGVNGTVDCSGMVVLCTNVARAVMGAPAVNVPDNSAAMAQVCHAIGAGVDAQVANDTPGYLGFHGPNEGMAGFGDAGHIKTKYWIARPGDPHAGPDVSIEAMGHFIGGVGYSTFIDPECTYFARNPFLDAPAPKVAPMFTPSLELNAWLYNPDKNSPGWWIGHPDGRVDFLAVNGAIYHGGMVLADGTPDPAFAGRTLSLLEIRWYIHNGVHKCGYTIVATSGETYVPAAQH